MASLTDDEFDALRRALGDLQEDLAQMLELSLDGARPVDLDQPIGRLSRMDAMQQQAMAKANRAGHQRRLQLVESALVSIKQQRFGECRRCEEPIGYPRLQVRPESSFCLDCQEQMEGAG